MKSHMCNLNNIENMQPALYSILIVEDTEFVNNYFHQVLKEKGFACQQAFTLEQAHKQLLNTHFDLIILDLHLPDGEGEELIENIASLQKSKIIIFTADSDKMRREEWMQYGVIDYIIKDRMATLTINDIIKTIDRLQKNSMNTILVIDDSLVTRKRIVKILESRDYKVIAVENGAKGLDILMQESIDLILLDLELPDMHGAKVLERIQKNPNTQRIPVFIVSGSDDILMLNRLRKSGAADLVKKPFNTDEIIDRVDFWIDFARKEYELKCQAKLLEEYKEAVDVSNIVSKTDQRGIITYVNDLFLNISGYEMHELIGKPHNIVRHPDMDSKIFKELWETISAKKVWQGIVKNKTKQGEAYYVKTVIKPILDFHGNISEYIAIRTDVTETEQAKEQLSKQLNHSATSFEDIYHLSQEYQKVIDTATIVSRMDTEGVITYVNQNFEQITGYTPEEIIGKKATILKHPDIPQSLYDHMWTTIKSGNIWKNTIKQKAKDGSDFWVNIIVVPIKNVDLTIREYMVIRNDITEITKLHHELEETQREIIFKMSEIGETRSKETGNHVKRVAEFAGLLAQKAGVSQDMIDLIKHASPMHDIGKVGIPDEVLLKPGKLSQEERVVIEKHSELGYAIFKGSKRRMLQASSIIALQHHEKWDGTGYPRGLKGKEIHLFGRIVAIADVFDALGSDRIYKPAWSIEDIIKFFIDQRGKHFDPKLVDIFLTDMDEFLAIRDKYSDV